MDANTKEVIILHISDLHFGMEDKSSSRHIRDREDVLKSFIESFDQFEVEERTWKPGVLAITGDIGFNGRKNNYTQAENFIKEIIEASGSITKDDIIICAGNHDILLPDYSAVLPLKDCDDLPDGCPLLTLEKIEKASAKFSNFSNFLLRNNLSILQHDKYKAKNSQQRKAGVLFGFRQIKGVNFLVLNSEWDFYGSLSGIYDYDGILRTGPDLLADSINQMKKNEVYSPVFALMHHPPHSLWRVEQGGYIENDPQCVWDLLKANVNVLLHGHTHQHLSNSRLKENTEVFSCSSLHSSDVNFYEAWLIKVVWNNKKINISAVPYKWQKRQSQADKFPRGRWFIEHSAQINHEFTRELAKNSKISYTVDCALKVASDLFSSLEQETDERVKIETRAKIKVILLKVKGFLPQLNEEVADRFRELVRYLSTNNEREEISPTAESPRGQARVLTELPPEVIDVELNKKGTK